MDVDSLCVCVCVQRIHITTNTYARIIKERVTANTRPGHLSADTRWPPIGVALRGHQTSATQNMDDHQIASFFGTVFQNNTELMPQDSLDDKILAALGGTQFGTQVHLSLQRTFGAICDQQPGPAWRYLNFLIPNATCSQGSARCTQSRQPQHLF